MAEHPTDFPRRELDAQSFLSSPSSSPWSFFPSRGPCSTAFPCVLPCIAPSLLHLPWSRPRICRSLHPLDTEALWLTPLRAEFLLCAARLGCVQVLSSTARHEVPTCKLSVGRAPSCRISSSPLRSPWQSSSSTQPRSSTPAGPPPRPWRRSVHPAAAQLVRALCIFPAWRNPSLVAEQLTHGAQLASTSSVVDTVRSASLAPIRTRSCRYRRVVAGDSFACCRAHRFPCPVLARFPAHQRALSACLALIPIASSTSPVIVVRRRVMCAALYTSPSCIIVEPDEPRSSLLDLVKPRLPDVRQK
jgi:hypothetical protein|uniref:Uncharacterized protein n=1 Tax=Zea mays TaxID=4577 RepID=B6U356_MAIZE|nr:hypothetical protein [Zea mays]